MYKRLIVIPFFLLLIFLILTDKSTAQPTLGIKAGIVYMTNDQDFSDNLGYSTGMSYYFLNVKGIELGVETSYARKGYRYIVWTYSDEIQSPLEFISVSIPIKNNQSISNSFDLFFLAGIRADLLLTDSKRFYSPVTGDGSKLNSTLSSILLPEIPPEISPAELPAAIDGTDISSLAALIVSSPTVLTARVII